MPETFHEQLVSESATFVIWFKSMVVYSLLGGRGFFNEK
jgi:hypothetical protein